MVEREDYNVGFVSLAVRPHVRRRVKNLSISRHQTVGEVVEEALLLLEVKIRRDQAAREGKKVEEPCTPL